MPLFLPLFGFLISLGFLQGEKTERQDRLHFLSFLQECQSSFF